MLLCQHEVIVCSHSNNNCEAHMEKKTKQKLIISLGIHYTKLLMLIQYYVKISAFKSSTNDIFAELYFSGEQNIKSKF